MGFTTDTKCAAKNGDSDGRRWKSDKRVDGNSSLSLSWKKKKKGIEKKKEKGRCVGNINKPVLQMEADTRSCFLPLLLVVMATVS